MEVVDRDDLQRHILRLAHARPRQHPRNNPPHRPQPHITPPTLTIARLGILISMPSPPNSPVDKAAKPPIYLLDSMAFIFRAYHAMQRQRPMSTRTGIPTAATYVFVNMINKLRKDFAPAYLAAIYDVGAPVHRNEMASQMKDVQKFNIKDPGLRDHRVRRLQS